MRSPRRLKFNYPIHCCIVNTGQVLETNQLIKSTRHETFLLWVTSSQNSPACKVLDNSIHSTCMLWEFRGSWNLVYILYNSTNGADWMEFCTLAYKSHSERRKSCGRLQAFHGFPILYYTTFVLQDKIIR